MTTLFCMDGLINYSAIHVEARNLHRTEELHRVALGSAQRMMCYFNSSILSTLILVRPKASMLMSLA